ncbi:hypothetical protein H6778_03785 [Candidatus Nomurabacteria bacterium]|nr:hypothetical protein [Candidatus Nomurabacteria bacterium]
MKILAAVLNLIVCSVMFMGLFIMSSDATMASSMTDCPFMSHEEVLCPMDLADHISAWKTVFMTNAPLVFLAGAVVVLLVALPWLVVPKWKPLQLLYQQLRERTYHFSSRAWQELFAAGILHPKLFS